MPMKPPPKNDYFGDPKDLTELEIGQTVEVEMVDEESPDDLTSPRSGA
jgi:hypothetical protein